MKLIFLPMPPALTPSVPLALDLFERAVIVTLYGFTALRMLTAFMATGQPHLILLLASEGLVLVFTIFRSRAAVVSERLRDWFVALFGSSLPLLVTPGGDPLVPLAPPILCLGVMFAGLAINIAAKLSLNRSFGLVAARRAVKVRGAYRFVRHPMYFGYTLTHVGFLLGSPSAWNLSLYATTFAIQVARLLAEERLLADDPAYRAYAEKVRYRLIPGVF